MTERLATALGFHVTQLEWNQKPQVFTHDPAKAPKRKRVRKPAGEEGDDSGPASPVPTRSKDRLMRLKTHTGLNPAQLGSVVPAGKLELTMEKNSRAEYGVTVDIDEEINADSMLELFDRFANKLRTAVNDEVDALLKRSDPKKIYVTPNIPFNLPVGLGGSQTGKVQLKIPGSDPGSKLGANLEDHVEIKEIVTNKHNVFGLPANLVVSPVGVFRDVNVEPEGLRLPKIGLFLQSMGNRLFFDGDKTLNGSLLALLFPGELRRPELFDNRLESSSILQKMTLTPVLIESRCDPGVLDMTFELNMVAEVSW